MFRLTLVSASIPLGLATGLCAWLLAGGAHAGFDRVGPIGDELARLAPTRRIATTTYAPSVADLVAQPIFATPEGQAADPSLRLVGLSLTAQRAAALLEIAGRPAEWLRVGEGRDGVTVQQVLSNRVMLDLGSGPRELTLGEAYAGTSASAGVPSGAVSAPGLAVNDRPPPGMRLPPAPASAPRAQ